MEAKRLKNCQTTVHNLPKEIIFEIFSRLPIQSICRVRFVCKSWFGFINDPDFANFHHSRIIRTDPSFLILSVPAFYLLELDDEYAHGWFLPKETSKPEKLISSVNGLVCLRYTYIYKSMERERFHIWNPITRDVFKLPLFPRNERTKDFSSKTGASGFALDSTTNRYKIVHSWYAFKPEDKVFNPEDKVVNTEIGIYTLGLNNWRMIQNVPRSFSFIENTSQVFLNGALHFRMKSDNLEYKNCIGVIDIASETFKVFKGPNFTDSEYSSLYVVEDRLCLSFYTAYRDCNIITLWTMNDYRVTGTWTERYIINDFFFRSIFNYSDHYVSQMGVTLKILNTGIKGEILFVGGDAKAAYYDLETKELRNLRISRIPKCEYWGDMGADVHVCSLISPRALAGARTRKNSACVVKVAKDISTLKQKEIELNIVL